MKAEKSCIFFITNLDSGGIENYLLRFLKHYNGNLHPTVVCKGNAFGELYDEYSSIRNIKLIKIKVGYFRPLTYLQLYRTLKLSTFDSIVDFTGNFGAIPVLLGKFAKIKKRIVFYRGSTNHFKPDVFRTLYNKLMNHITKCYATDILANSQAAIDFFFPNQSDLKFEVIYNGIDSTAFLNTSLNLREQLNIPNSSFVVGHIGRYDYSKNHKTIIEVAIALCKKQPNIYFVLCGKNVDTSLEDIVKKEHLEERIILLGFRKDVIKVLNTIDLFYFPSLTEGQPNALIEALIAGKPFVASNIDPIKETIPLEYHHLLIEPTDQMGAIEKVMKFYKGKDEDKVNSLQSWAIANYDADKLFTKFYSKI